MQQHNWTTTNRGNPIKTTVTQVCTKCGKTCEYLIHTRTRLEKSRLERILETDECKGTPST